MSVASQIKQNMTIIVQRFTLLFVSNAFCNVLPMKACYLTNIMDITTIIIFSSALYYCMKNEESLNNCIDNYISKPWSLSDKLHSLQWSHDFSALSYLIAGYSNYMDYSGSQNTW